MALTEQLSDHKLVMFSTFACKSVKAVASSAAIAEAITWVVSPLFCKTAFLLLPELSKRHSILLGRLSAM
jgi:hypothetical protein